MTERLTVEIDGSQGEGGGQVLRSSLALAIATGKNVVLTNIRAKRSRPGLQPQHVAAVRAAASICGANVEGAKKGSSTLRFEPGPVVGGKHVVDIGTAGAATLVIHTVTPALLATRTAATLVVTGGTHVPMSPPYEHLALAYAPTLAHFGGRVLARIERHGFYPAGGGRIVVDIERDEEPRAIDLTERGAVRALRLIAISGHGVPDHVAPREIAVVREGLAAAGHAELDVENLKPGTPGNALALVVEAERAVDVISAVGARGVRAERVASDVVTEAREHLASGAPVGLHLADQLLLPMALLRGGRFVTLAPLTLHTRTHAEVIRAFLDVDIAFTVRDDEKTVFVDVRT